MTDALHEDQCNCREWPTSCFSGLTRDRLEPSGIDATVHALADAGLLRITPDTDTTKDQT